MKVRVTNTLRPIRFGVLSGSSEDAILSALRLNTYLWGGTLNPIIPADGTVPTLWANDMFGRPRSPEAFVAQCTARFDPDALVIMNEATSPFRLPSRSGFDHREVTAEDVLREPVGFENRYGISIFDVASIFIDRELRFIRKEPIRFVRPVFEPRWHLLQALLYGELDPTFDEHFDSILTSAGADIENPQLPIERCLSMLDRDCVSLRRLTQYNAGFPPRTPVFYVLDPDRHEHLLDVLFMRAEGQPVIPIPIQALGNVDFQSDLKKIVGSMNPRVTLPRYLSEGVNNIQQGLGVSCSFLIRYEDDLFNFPPDEAGQLGIRSTSSVSLEEGSVSIQLQQPFDGDIRPSSGLVFANDIEVWAFSAGKLPAEIIPAGLETIWAPDKWYHLSHGRISANAITLYPNLSGEEAFPLPDANTIIRQYYKANGWASSPSDEGLRVAQALDTIGGLYNAGFLTRNALGFLKHDGPFDPQGIIRAKTFKSYYMQHDQDEDNESRALRAENLSRSLRSMGVMALGVQLQCPTCRRSPWYSIENLKREVECTFCRADVAIWSLGTREMLDAWAYRLHPPLDDPNSRANLLGVFAAAHFFAHTRARDKTIGLGLNLERNAEKVEIDLTVLADAAMSNREPFEPIFVESKGYWNVDADDIRGFERLLSTFPRATYIFTTLRESLTSEERDLIARFAALMQGGNLPTHNVAILTHLEMSRDMDDHDYENSVLHPDLTVMGEATRIRHLE